MLTVPVWVVLVIEPVLLENVPLPPVCPTVAVVLELGAQAPPLS